MATKTNLYSELSFTANLAADFFSNPTDKQTPFVHYSIVTQISVEHNFNSLCITFSLAQTAPQMHLCVALSFLSKFKYYS